MIVEFTGQITNKATLTPSFFSGNVGDTFTGSFTYQLENNPDLMPGNPNVGQYWEGLSATVDGTSLPEWSIPPSNGGFVVGDNISGTDGFEFMVGHGGHPLWILLTTFDDVIL
jgi:hypothetical protein